MKFQIGEKAYVPEYAVLGTVTKVDHTRDLYEVMFDYGVTCKRGITTTGVGHRKASEFIHIDIWNSPLMKALS